MAGESKTTTEHDVIKGWVESRGGHPAMVKGTKRGDTEMLRIDFPGYSGEDSLEPISWDEFFHTFEEKNLALVYQDELKSGEESRFCKIVSR